ncbi:MAG TPA: macrolide ABC transporter ATP-binding protein [Syntrophomonas sp.]|jgi:putative ABC transport system ATP-binding protein|nr:macrolide ABC transporter ATP-binding protein [Syntrophomonas sp.]
MNQPLIKLEEIVKTYYGAGAPVRALRGITLDIGEHEMTAIMGYSGSGKSTLMNLLGCLDKPDSGSYTLAGYEVMALAPEQLAFLRNRLIGFVFQNFNLLGRASALENVTMPLIYAGIKSRERQRRALEMLNLVGLKGREHHRPNQLSGGQQQRVAIARALVNRPRLILADEPTGALDTSTSHEIMALLQNLHREQQLAIVIVTHENEIGQHCQRIIRLSDGMVVNTEAVKNQLRAIPAK